MKKAKVMCKFFALFTLLLLFSCKNQTTPKDRAGTNQPDGLVPQDPPKIGDVKAEYKDLVTVISKETEVKGKRLPYLPAKGVIFYYAGVFVEGRNLKLKPYQIGKYEVTYELWTEVLAWAVEHDYTIRFQGRGGSHSPENGNKPFVPANDGNKHHPVVSIPWRSMLVWCNAYSEMTGLSPVYYADPEFSEPIKSTFPCPKDDEQAVGYDNINPYDGPGFVDTPYVKWDSTGFRLPTEAEWEAAARGGDPNAETWNLKYAGCNDEASLGDYAWTKENSDNKTHEVGKKKPKSLGLHDMCGNVQEQCFDWFVVRESDDELPTFLNLPWYGPDKRPSNQKPSNSARIWRGNGYSDDINIFNFSLGFRFGYVPTRSAPYCGFRVARSIR